MSFVPARFGPLLWLVQHPVARHQPIRTASRWFYWQLRQRLTSRPKIMSFIDDTRLQIDPGGALTGCWYVSLPEFGEMVFLLRLLRHGDVFFDVGANAGAFSVLAASRGCTVVAFEPIPQTCEQLRVNAELNRGRGTIKVMNCALGAAAGQLRMTDGLGPGNHFLADGDVGPSVSVKVSTLDACCQEHADPSFIKIDVEGFELEVIQGGGAALANPKLIGLLIETFRPHNFAMPKLQALERLLKTFGFEPYDYDPKNKLLRQLQKPDEGENNTLYLRDRSAVESRLQNSSANLRKWGLS